MERGCSSETRIKPPEETNLGVAKALFKSDKISFQSEQTHAEISHKSCGDSNNDKGIVIKCFHP